METKELQSLTPLRGIAAIWVICFHYAVVYFGFRPEQFSWVFNKGYLAVDIFFMLSGFVLSHVYWRTFSPEATGHAKNYWSFIGARIARLYPLHLFNLGLFVVVTLAFSVYAYVSFGKFDSIPVYGARSWTALLANLAMLQGLKARELAWNFPAWSISVEFFAYFLFPLALPFVARASGPGKLFLAGLALLALCLFAYLGNGDFNQWDGPITLLRCLPEFVFGALLYAGFREKLWPDWFKRDYAIIAILLGVLALLHFGISDFIIVVGFPAVILSAVMNAGRMAPILNAAPLVWLGNISYSLYLAHGFVQFLTTKSLESYGVENAASLSLINSVWLLLAMLGATVLIATFTYREVEIAGRSRLRKLFQPRSEQAPPRNATRARPALDIPAPSYASMRSEARQLRAS
jgi:peptidoglycan/LPS O-acetylase OafA/YrhL